jgi:hypothetical protein
MRQLPTGLACSFEDWIPSPCAAILVSPNCWLISIAFSFLSWVQVTHAEFRKMKHEFERQSHTNNGVMTRSQFLQTIQVYVSTWTTGNVFLERLFDAFDENGDGCIDFKEFIHGLGVFARGTPEEKLECTRLSSSSMVTGLYRVGLT